MDSQITPVSLAMVGPGRLEIGWSDGRQRQYDPAALRRNCPCATCLTAPPPETPAGGDPITIRRMSPVGNYAYKIEFSDGHDTGIFPLDLLLELGEPA